jgi:hypothetical protein
VRGNCFAAAAISLVKIRPPQQKAFLFSSFREPCNHPNFVVFVVEGSSPRHSSEFGISAHALLIECRVISGFP